MFPTLAWLVSGRGSPDWENGNPRAHSGSGISRRKFELRNETLAIRQTSRSSLWNRLPRASVCTTWDDRLSEVSNPENEAESV